MNPERFDNVVRSFGSLLARRITRRTALVTGVGFVFTPGMTNAASGFFMTWKRGSVIQPVSRAAAEVTAHIPENISNWDAADGGMLSYRLLADLGYTPDNGLVPADGEMLFTSCPIGIKLVDGVPQCSDNNDKKWSGYAVAWGDGTGHLNRAKVVIKATAETPADQIRHNLCHETGHALGHDAEHPPAGTDSCITVDSGITTPGSYDAQNLQAALANQKDDPPPDNGGGDTPKRKCKGKGKKKRRCKKKQK